DHPQRVIPPPTLTISASHESQIIRNFKPFQNKVEKQLCPRDSFFQREWEMEQKQEVPSPSSSNPSAADHEIPQNKENLEDFENNNRKLPQDSEKMDIDHLMNAKADSIQKNSELGKCETSQNEDEAMDTFSSSSTPDLGEAQVCQFKQDESEDRKLNPKDFANGMNNDDIDGTTEERQEPEPESVDSRKIAQQRNDGGSSNDNPNVATEGSGNDVMKGDDDDDIDDSISQTHHHNADSFSLNNGNDTNNASSAIHHANRIIQPSSSINPSVVKSGGDVGINLASSQITSTNHHHHRPIAKMTIGGDTSGDKNGAPSTANIGEDEKPTEYQLRIHATDLQQEGFDTSSTSGSGNTAGTNISSTAPRHQSSPYQNQNSGSNNNSGGATSSASATAAAVTTSVSSQHHHHNHQQQQQQSRGVIHYTHQHMGANQDHNKSKAPK
ncbi:hypothetical protein Ocin01_09796, partial [Orchesella cincta]